MPMNGGYRLPQFIRIALYALLAAAALAYPFLVTFISYDSSSPHAPVAVGGLIDLTSWDLDRDGSVPLLGEWAYFPGELLDGHEAARRAAPVLKTVPDLWSGTGAGTYQLRVRLPPLSRELALRWTTIATAFSVSADGVPLASVGVPGIHNDIPAYNPGIAPIFDWCAADGDVVISVRVSNHVYRSGGIWRPIVIGQAHELFSAKRYTDLVTLLFAGILLGVAIQHFAIFLFRHTAWSSLLLACFTLLVALRGLVTGEYLLVDFFPNMPFDTLIRLEYVSAFVLVPAGLLFFDLEFRKRIPWIALVLLAPFSLLIPFAPLPILTRSMPIFNPLAFAAVLYLAFSVVRTGLREKQYGMFPSFLGMLCVFSAAINDMLFSSFRIHTGNVLPFALVVFTVLTTISLSWKYVLSYRQNEQLLAEKETYLKEMHHRVKNSLQIVASVMSLQANRVADPETKGLFAVMRERVRSVALVHEKLHTSLRGEDVDLADYIGDLVRQVASSYAADEEVPSISASADLGTAPIEFCVDIGLALTELLINAYKHAERPVLVSLERSGNRLIAAVADRGPGFPEGFDAFSNASLGFKIVSSVVRRKGGGIRIKSEGGSLVELSVPIPEAKR